MKLRMKHVSGWRALIFSNTVTPRRLPNISRSQRGAAKSQKRLPRFAQRLHRKECADIGNSELPCSVPPRVFNRSRRLAWLRSTLILVIAKKRSRGSKKLLRSASTARAVSPDCFISKLTRASTCCAQMFASSNYFRLWAFRHLEESDLPRPVPVLCD